MTSATAERLATVSHLILLCGHYEGIDQRVLDSDVDEEVSIGDYVLTNGCLASLVLIDAVVRFIPGVLGHEEAALCDSFQRGILEGPVYTRPENFEGALVPEVLRNGNHRQIEEWRQAQGLEKTKRVRPELIFNEE